MVFVWLLHQDTHIAYQALIIADKFLQLDDIDDNFCPLIACMTSSSTTAEASQ